MERTLAVANSPRGRFLFVLPQYNAGRPALRTPLPTGAWTSPQRAAESLHWSCGSAARWTWCASAEAAQGAARLGKETLQELE